MLTFCSPTPNEVKLASMLGYFNEDKEFSKTCEVLVSIAASLSEMQEREIDNHSLVYCGSNPQNIHEG